MILVFEGGFTDNPKDHGGRTNKGIIQREYDKYRQNKSLPLNDVKNISDTEVRDIYLNQYWLPSKCNQMPAKVSTAVFDTSVNCGQSRSIKTLQQAIGAVVDGIIGNETLTKLKNYDPLDLSNKFLDKKEAFYRGIVANNPDQVEFLNGWLRRTKYVRDFVNGVKTLAQIKATW